MPAQNRIARTIAPLQSLPSFLRARAQTLLFRRMVPFTGTARLLFEEVTGERVSISIHNRRRVQNHIQGVHAAATALLGETATGFVVGMNLPDDKLPLLRRMSIDYTRRSKGDIRATATLTEEQRAAIVSEPKGEVTVPVTVTDASGEAPVTCEFVWAWIPKKR